MSELSVALAKLAGLKKAVVAMMNENVSGGRSQGRVLTPTHYRPDVALHYFLQASQLVERLKVLHPALYGDLQPVSVEPEKEMVSTTPGEPAPKHFSRAQAERLVRDIDQIFEIRANSELQQSAPTPARCVFVSHGRSPDWRAVQIYIEKDVALQTIELAQQPNLGRTIIEKLFENAGRCDSAVIVMTGDDVVGDDQARVRENVMHEIGFFQGRYGRDRVILLHEEGVNVPTNLSGVAYVPYPKGAVDAGFHVLRRELEAVYKR